MRRQFGITEKNLRKAQPEAVKRLARWLCAEPKFSNNAKDQYTLLIYAVLRQLKRLDNLPRGTLPSDIRK